MVKRQIALVLAGAAASIAVGLRLVQELVEQGEQHAPGAGEPPAEAETKTPPPETKAPETAADDGAAPETTSAPAPAATMKAPAGATKAELYEMATDLDIAGRSKMNKAELVEAINAAG